MQVLVHYGFTLDDTGPGYYKPCPNYIMTLFKFNLSGITCTNPAFIFSTQTRLRIESPELK
jgi:hypothetical protein